MLHALWVVLFGMAALFLVQGVIFLSIILLKKLDAPERDQGERD